MTGLNLESLLKKNRCGAVVSVARSQWDWIKGAGEYFDLRFQDRGASPFGSLEHLEKLSGSPFLAQPQWMKGYADFREYPFADLDFILGIRQKGHRVLCYLEDRNPAEPPALSPEEKLKARLWLASKYFPQEFLRLLSENKKLSGPETPLFFSWVQRFICGQDSDSLAETMPVLGSLLCERHSRAVADRFFGRLELIAGYRQKPSIGIYDHALQLAGGGQKYACVMAAALQHDFDVTFIANKPVTRESLEAWYGLDLSRCSVKIVPLPFYEEKKSEFIDQSMARREAKNPFEPVSEESRRYDIFINVNMLTLVKPQAPVSIFLCHFPDSKKHKFFCVGDYTYIIANSLYTIDWLKKRWNFLPSAHIYPPIDMLAAASPKQPIILSVARFEASGSKKQLELIEVFSRLRAESPVATQGWKLVLAGGSFGRNLYLKKIQKRAKLTPGIEVYANLHAAELKALYSRASIFWHACGLNTNIPERVEHFGMTTVEAMQNGCVPVVINKGGQKEIVEAGISGFLFHDLKELHQMTMRLINDRVLLERASVGARSRAKRFSGDRFKKEIMDLFARFRHELMEQSLS